MNKDIKIYPEFFRTELLSPANTVKYFVSNEGSRAKTISFG